MFHSDDIMGFGGQIVDGLLCEVCLWSGGTIMLPWQEVLFATATPSDPSAGVVCRTKPIHGLITSHPQGL